MAKVTQATKDDRLAKLQQKMAQADYGGSSGFLTLKQGNTKLRILPQVGDMEAFYQPVGRHFIPNAEGKKDLVYCPEFTSEGALPCPICEHVQKLYRGNASDKQLASNLRVNKTFWMNVIDRGNEKAGVQIFTPGVSVLTQLGAIIADPDWGFIMDEETGHDVTINRDGEGMNTKYNVNASPKPSPLHRDDATFNKWIDSAQDLSFVEVSEDPEEDADLAAGHAVYVFPYNRILDEYDLDALSELDIPDEPKPANNKAKKIVTVVAPLDEEDDDVEEDEVEEEKPVNPARQRLIARRQQR